MPDMTDLEGYMAALRASFDAERAGQRRMTVQYTFTGAVNGACHAVIADGALCVAEGQIAAPTVAVTADFDLWRRIVSYEIDPLMAYQEGLYTADGDLEALIEVDTLFRR